MMGGSIWLPVLPGHLGGPIGADVQIPVERLSAYTGKPGNLSDREVALVVLLLGSPNGSWAELPLPAAFTTSGPAGSQPRVGPLDEQLPFHLGHGGDDLVHQPPRWGPGVDAQVEDAEGYPRSERSSAS